MSQIWFEIAGLGHFELGTELNQSRMRLYKQCHRKYWWQYGENLTLERPAARLELGTAIHKVLQVVQSGKPLEEGIKQGRAHLKSIPTKGHIGLDEEVQDALETLERIMPAYYHNWAGTEHPWKSLGQEVSGRVEVGKNSGNFLIVKIDDLGVFRDALWIVDHKSAAKLDMRIIQQYQMDIQPTAYIYAASKLLGKRVAGIIINLLVKTKIPQFHRELYLKSNDELRQFVREWNEVCYEIRWRHERVKKGEDPKTVFYKTETECTSFGGTCWYRPLCLDDTPAERLVYVTRRRDYVDDPALLKGTK